MDNVIDTKLMGDIKELLNSHSREQDSDTPDFILAEYLMACLEAFEVGVNRRDVWYGVNPSPANKIMVSK